MKKIIALLMVVMILLTGCSKRIAMEEKYTKQVVGAFSEDNNSEALQLTETDFNRFVAYLDYNGIQCPYGELFGIDEALVKKEKLNLSPGTHTYSFFDSDTHVDADKLYNVVRENNKAYMEQGIAKYFNEEFSASDLKTNCEYVANAINAVIDTVEGIDTAELGCILGNLKILIDTGTVNNGSFNRETNVLNLSPDMIKRHYDRIGTSGGTMSTLYHEAMHILQCRCCDVSGSEADAYIGTSFYFDELKVNPLNTTWIYEASAELNSARMLNENPSIYTHMIDNLETIALATLLDNKAEVNEISFFSFTKDAESLYDLIGFSDRKKAMEFLYAVELLRVKPDEFKDKYESTYGKLTEDYGEFLKKTYNPYFVEVTSKLFYYNLAQKLTKEEMTLSDVFYLISMYESDLLKDIPFNISDVKQKYIDTYEKYINMQKEFFNLLQNVADKDVLQAFGAYNMNYGEGTVYANASLKWLDARKKDYLIYRNNILYSKNRMCMLDFCEDD